MLKPKLERISLSNAALFSLVGTSVILTLIADCGADVIQTQTLNSSTEGKTTLTLMIYADFYWITFSDTQLEAPRSHKR